MKKFNFKKIAAMAMAAMTTVSAMSISVFAAANIENKTVDSDVHVVAFDKDGNEIEIPLFFDEEAAQMSEAQSKARLTYSVWNWSRGYCTSSLSANAGYPIPYVFTPTNNGRIGFESLLYGCTGSPCISVNDYTLEQSGQNGYVGSFYYDNLSGSTYEISYVIKGLTKSHTFRFYITGNGNWNSGTYSVENVDSL